jgi:hypothetical protein
MINKVESLAITYKEHCNNTIEATVETIDDDCA